MAEFSPGEHLEAKDKFERNQKGRPEAATYRLFIESLRAQVVDRLNKEGYVKAGYLDGSIQDKTLREFLHPYNLEPYIEHATEFAGGAPALNTKVLLDMTLSQFLNHLDEVENSLIK